MPFENVNIAFIGGGVMGEAIIKGLLGKKLMSASQICVSDPHQARLDELSTRYNVQTTTDNLKATETAHILVLAVKPQVMSKIFNQLRGKVDHCSLILSIAAGITMKSIAGELLNARIVRAMPNTPGQIGKGMTVWTSTSEIGHAEREQTQALLGALGDEMFVEEEYFLDMATALSATGPAYVFLFMEALIDAGVHMGFSRRDSERLVLQTMRGSVEYAIESGLHPAQLRNQVTSPGGTSAEALYQLEKGGIRTVISRAVYAAYRKAAFLGSRNEPKG